MNIMAQGTQLQGQDSGTDRRRETPVSHARRSLLLMALIVASSLAWADLNQANAKAEDAEVNTQRKQAALDLRREWRFDQDMKGRPPTGFSMKTVGNGQTGMWRVEAKPHAISIPNLLVQTASCEGEGCFQLLLADGVRYDYVDLTFRLRSQSGNSAGIAGAVFGVRDPNNFYAVLVDLSTDTLSVLRVLDGKETILGSAAVTRKPSDWHHMRVQRNTIISKEIIEAFFDHKLTVSVQDQTFGRGQIGLVTRGTVPMAFDNVHAIRIYSQHPLSGPAAY